MSYRPSSVGLSAKRSRPTVLYPNPKRPGVWRTPAAIRAMRGSRGLLGLLGLGTDVADPGGYVDPNSVIAPTDTSNPIMTAIPVTTQAQVSIATVPTQQPDGSMAPTPIWTAPAPSTPKKWYSFLETTKADGTVTGPLGMSWTTWLVGGGIAALVFANRNSGGGSEESSEPSTPNRRRRARRNKKRARRNSRRRGSRRSR